MTRDALLAELAPSVVVRATRFPVRALESLADSALAEIAMRAVARRDAETRSSFERAYDESAEGQRRILWKLTVEDARFVRALALTNEELARRVLDRPLRPARNKRARHLETTLYRYLARAVWRTEPCDLWAGMTVATWGEATRILPSRTRYAIAPDLRPFQAMVQALSRTELYRTAGVYKLNPTLERDGQQWRYFVRDRNGELIPSERPNRAWLEASLEALDGCPPGSLDRLSDALRRRSAIEPARAFEVLLALRDTGILVGGLAFPTRFASAWEALRAVPVDLNAEHARPWRLSVAKLRRLCLRLERRIETIPLAELHLAQTRVREEVRSLADALGVAEPWLPRSVLRCDHRLPFDVVLGPEVRERFAAAVAEYDAFEGNLGLDAAVRAAHRARLLRTQLSDTPPSRSTTTTSEHGENDVPTQERAWRRAGADDVLGRRMAQWSRWLESGTRTQDCDADPSTAPFRLPPVAVTVLRPLAKGFSIVGCTPEVVPSYGRYAPLWADAGPSSPLDGLHGWYEATLAREGRKAGIDVVELVSPCETAPNALARPKSRFSAWDVWGTTSSFRVDRVRIDLARGGSAPVAIAEGLERPVSVACFVPADVARSDRWMQRLLLTSFREVPNWISDALPFECELQRRSTSPRLTLRSGNVVRARRTVVVGEELEALVVAEYKERFAVWQALARRYEWPALVLVSKDGGPPLLVVRDSSLAVESALEGIGERVRFLTVEEPDDQTWLEDEDGERLATEFIVPFVRRHHAWSVVDAGQRPAREARWEL